MANQVLAFSGGKDSTALALRLAELGEDFDCLFTPTGNELPELRAHIDGVVASVGKRLIEPPNRPLDFWINEFKAVPNNRQRWCTRLIKIAPCIAYLKEHPGTTLLVGLRADEEDREGLYGPYAHYRHPMKEWGWTVREVWSYLDGKGVKIPRRTDCALCYDQRLPEWWLLWKDHPEEFAKGEAIEAMVLRERGVAYTFRSPHRDAWPAPLKDLRAEFERGRRPRGLQMYLDRGGARPDSCRVCSL